MPQSDDPVINLHNDDLNGLPGPLGDPRILSPRLVVHMLRMGQSVRVSRPGHAPHQLRDLGRRLKLPLPATVSSSGTWGHGVYEER